MDIGSFFSNFQLSQQAQQFLILLAARLGLLLLAVLAAVLVGRLLPWVLKRVAARTLSVGRFQAYEAFMDPLRKTLAWTITLILASVSLNIVRVYAGFYGFISFFVDGAVAISIAWFISRTVKQVIRIYGINLFKRISDEVNDVVLIFETIVNVFIGFFTITVFAQSRDFNFLALLTGFGIGAAGIAFAAQEALGQLIGTIVIYLDRPYSPGEYVRVNFNIHAEDVYGRIESIGIRSTKIRVAVTNTLIIVPNSIMAKKDIENVSRGTKVMVLIYIDFPAALSEGEEALVAETVEKSIDSLFGIDPGSTRIS
ncbi:mechanosensitive ion channel protein MscS, partial [filamentous cyanobacterium CCP5]